MTGPLRVRVTFDATGRTVDSDIQPDGSYDGQRAVEGGHASIQPLFPGSVAQPAEAARSNRASCGFESRPAHQQRGAPC